MKRNLLLCVVILSFIASVTQAQIAFNNNFETWSNDLPDDWMGTQTTIEEDSVFMYTIAPFSGTRAVKLQNREIPIKKFSTQAFSIVEGEKYYVSFWAKGRGNIASIKAWSGNNTNVSPLIMVNTETWVYYERSFTASVSSDEAELVFEIRQTKVENDDLQLDDVTIYKSAGSNAMIDNVGIYTGMNAGGELFNQVFEVPAGSGNHTIYIANMWMGGISQNSELHVAAQRYGSLDDTFDYAFGPIADSYYSPDYMARYNRVWKLTAEEIDQHIAHFADGGYEMPEAIANWPANGDEENGEAALLAPFFDGNENEIYEPQIGEYPLIRGSMAIYAIFNDHKITHASGGQAIGIEVHAMMYSVYEEENFDLLNTIFVNYQIYNRSANDYHAAYFGSFSDMDLGAAGDDYVGCDVDLNMYYTYNATNADANYGEPAPAQGSVFLNHPISHFVYYWGSGDYGEPEVANDFYNYLKGVWKNGEPMTYGGTGYGGETLANYMFTGIPETGEGWTEIGTGTTPGDRRGLMSVGPFSMASGGKICVDLAFPFARDIDGTNLSSIALLRQRVQAIQTYYDEQGYICEIANVGIHRPAGSIANVRVYPNPSSGIVFFDLGSTEDAIVKVYSPTGSMICEKHAGTSTFSIDLSACKGMLLYVVADHNGSIIAKGKVFVD